MKNFKDKQIKRFFNQAEKLNLKNVNYFNQFKTLSQFFLENDLGKKGDLTSHLLIDKKKICQARIISRQSGILAGLQEAVWLFKKRNIKVKTNFKDGDKLRTGQVVLSLQGKLSDVLAIERTVLNILQRLSGIASLTASLVKIAKDRVLLCPTRKTQWGLLDKRAVVMGGGGTHRLGLDDFVLIKENHLQDKNLNHLPIKELKKVFWEVEVENRAQALQLAKYYPGAIMFDNFKPEKIKKLVKEIKKINPNIIFEASGGINSKNLSLYSKTGVDIISLGALTHSAPALDLSLLVG